LPASTALVPHGTVADLAVLMAAHRRWFVLTGAGVSTGSGIPDYRDRNGDWKRQRPVQYQEFMTDPSVRARYWARSMVGWRSFAAASPNAAHLAVARLEKMGRIGLLVTQNVDGLHQAAGSRRVIDLHGRLDRVHCMSCRQGSRRAAWQHLFEERNQRWAGLDAPVAPDGDADLGGLDFSAFDVPGCPSCGGIVKPDVVFFGEALPEAAIERASVLAREAALLLVVGSSLEVYPVAGLPDETLAAGGLLAIVNRGGTPYDGVAALVLDGDAAEILPLVAAELGA